MKGVIFDLLQQVVTEKYGDDTWESLLDATGLPGVYTAVGSYPDEELLQLVSAASSALNVDADDLTRWFGRSCIPLLAERFPTFFQARDDVRSFLLTLNEVIHPEVRKLFPGAYAPSFAYTELPGGSLALGYHSHRGLCSFAEGLIEGTADHYGEVVSISQSECTKRGDPICTLVTEFKGKA